MKIAGIIVEYNPMHNGHIFHINKTKEITNCDIVIAVMSGNFTQRGIPSILDKWTKTKLALQCGADVVIELPAIYAVSSAEFFSYGAVSLLNSLGVVDSICFGSECGNIEALKSISHIFIEEPKVYRDRLKYYLGEGNLFVKARNLALIDYVNSNHNSSIDLSNISQLLKSSNNILGIEYLKSLEKLKSTIIPYTIKREGGSYNSTNLDSTFSSATSLRNYIKTNDKIEALKDHLPSIVYNELLKLHKENYDFPFSDSMYPYIKYKILTSKNSLSKLPDISEGLDNKIIKAIESSSNYYKAIDAIKSKRYTYTRISRLLCQYFLGFEEFNTLEMRKIPCPYAKILGFNNKGLTVLKSIKANSAIPMYTKLPKSLHECLSLDIRCTNAYSMLNSNINYNDDYLISPIKI